jgi:hypothetical protein
MLAFSLREVNSMKTILVAIFICCASAAFGQVGGSISSVAQPMQMADHPQHASPHAMATEQSIVGGVADDYMVAHGERPLWEFGPVKEEPSLGDVARAYRKEKMTAKKAAIVLEKQGS